MVERFANVWLLVISWALVFFFTFALFGPQGKKYGGLSTVDGTRWGVSPSGAATTLETFKQRGLIGEYRHQERDFDLLFPLVYGLALCSSFAFALRATGAPRALILIPIAGALADYVENISVLIALGQIEKGAVSPGVLVAISIGSRLKWLLLVGSLVLLAALTVWWIGAAIARWTAKPRVAR